MFCPNCGKDCGNANFCSHCGTRIQQEVKAEAKSAVWSVGQACPHCGGTKLEGNNCAFCGAQLIKEDVVFEKNTWRNIPLGIYPGPNGYLKLTEDKMVIRNHKMQECIIPYNEIEAVQYTKPGLFHFGQLSVRFKENAHIPFPKSITAGLRDAATFSNALVDDDLFLRLYYAIKDYIEEK